ncbi:hypothetical protein [Lewinella sp. IMCC34191]|uniref:hypothetical protein n=1 Tax=Lewinella sp. IMCC34191 TaxID=2259172 RepID=UPI000E222D02|nr:hypothetical protein [Lewinella sp. IMCC34191]
MVRFLLSLCLLLFSKLTAQDFPASASPDHVAIEGTNLYLVPPTGFRPSENFKGFQHPDIATSMIMVMEIPGPFTEVTGGFTEEALTRQGMTLNGKESTKLGPYDALLLAVDQTAQGMDFAKHILVYGDSTATTLVNATFLKDSVALGRRMRRSILSTYVDADEMSDPRAALDFTLDEERGDLLFVSVMGNGMLFNRDGRIPTRDASQIGLIADRSYAEVDIANRRNFPALRIHELPGDYTFSEDAAPVPVKIDGLEGYALEAHNDEENLYQVILYREGGGYYIFVGTYHPETPGALDDIRAVINSFQRK